MQIPNRILITEDNKSDLGLILRELTRVKKNFIYHHVQTIDDFKHELDSFKPGLILSDYNLPTFSGMEAIEINNRHSGEIPLIIVSGTIGEERAAAVIRAGASDYVLKQHLDKLPLAIDRVMKEAEERRRRREAEFKSNQQQKLLSAIINQTGSIIYVKDQAGRYRLVNDTYLDLFGLKRENVINKTYRDVHGDNLADEMEANDKAVLESQKEVEYEWQRQVNDETRYFHTIKYPLEGVPGYEHCLCGISLEITARVRMENQIKRSLTEKNVLLQEIHHRVKNNLAVVSGLLELQRYSSKDKKLDTILANSQSRIKSIALIHENLYKSDLLSEINFEHYLKDLVTTVEKINDIGDKIRFELVCDAELLNVNQAVPCALIVNELVTNSIQHAFKGKKRGVIRIELQEASSGILTVSVKDNGIGFLVDNIEGENQKMGYTIINTLITQLHSELHFDVTNGTAVTFSFRKREKRGSVSAFI